MGLSVVHGIVTGLGGAITVDLRTFPGGAFRCLFCRPCIVMMK